MSSEFIQIIEVCQICNVNDSFYVETCDKCCSHKSICNICARGLKKCCLSNIMLKNPHTSNLKCYNKSCPKATVVQSTVVQSTVVQSN